MNIPEALIVGGAGVVIVTSVMSGIVAFLVKRQLHKNKHPDSPSTSTHVHSD